METARQQPHHTTKISYAILKYSKGSSKMSYRTEKAADISLIGGRGKVRHEEGRVGADLDFDTTPIKCFLITRLSGNSISLRVKFDNGSDRIAFCRENLQSIDFATLCIHPSETNRMS